MNIRMQFYNLHRIFIQYNRIKDYYGNQKTIILKPDFSFCNVKWYVCNRHKYIP